ncbi:MAG: hypothetical protein NTW16_00735 [Bacteroidetes bacterium]|nr:hypothetical protein [Bacteroidota bacterium]
MQTGITAIYPVEDLGSTPARVNRKTGELYINMKKWADLSPEARLFVLLHEAGHVDQDTKNEVLADNYAFYAYARAGKPLSKSIQALTRLLNFENPQHYERVRQQINRAFAYDYHVNGNQAANPEKMRTALFSPPVMEPGDGYNNFLHLLIPKKIRTKIKSKIQADRKKRKEKKQQKKEAPVKAAAALPATPQVGQAPAPMLKTTAAVLPVINTPAGSNSKKGYYIAGALLILVIAAAGYYFIKKRR